jgi:hypothetical protein
VLDSPVALPVGRSSGVAGIAGTTVEVLVPGCSGWHDLVYRNAERDLKRVPWADLRPDAAMVHWLNSDATARLRPGCRAAVVGCGLGDDVVELLARGFDAVGFDVSPCAVDWAKERWPEHADAFVCADLADLPQKLRRRFDLVVEINTIQSVVPERRATIAAGIAGAMHPRGCVLAVCRRREDCVCLADEPGPPWALTRAELCELMQTQGLKQLDPIHEFKDEQTEQPVLRMRGVFGA